MVFIGAASILAALDYSGGPYPLASNALGDLFVFIFFGLVAVCGTYYVQTLKLTATVLLMGADVGLLITAILVVNNLRDISTDNKTGKRTLAVRLGTSGTKIESSLLLAGTYSGPVAFWLRGIFPIWILLPLVSAPLAWRQIHIIRRTTGGPKLNHTLAATAKLAFFSACFCPSESYCLCNRSRVQVHVQKRPFFSFLFFDISCIERCCR